MTADEKERIRELRSTGCSYAQIAKLLGNSEGSIKSFCSRNSVPLGGIVSASVEDDTHCKQCGKHLVQIPKHKTKRFCSDACRLAWWNTHRDKVQKKVAIKLACVYCGKLFESYINENRKYCSHECYISDRFGNTYDARAV